MTPRDRDRILEMLQHRAAWGTPDERWVCGSEFLAEFMPTYSQRIGDLRADGVPIQRGRCRGCLGRRHRSPLGRYRLAE